MGELQVLNNAEFGSVRSLMVGAGERAAACGKERPMRHIQEGVSLPLISSYALVSVFLYIFHGRSVIIVSIGKRIKVI